ncbi:hypothetical protein LOC67_16845 [Stieleria sp. JC731]|uniref:hypothetical protein n=1 Tax=Stieleria sp. JC731 TaxID=2894195 RepID=UPI001E4592B1|nr:hypothetical protein [Stieleria sp. JC731]MCC9602225.1 hypothetical protein [Stieleria sp. JC731]
MKTSEGISITPTSYQEIVALLTSDELAAVECSIAEQCRLKIIRDLASTTTSHLQAEVSVSGMTIPEITHYLNLHRYQLVAFGIQLLGDKDASKEEQEYPDGEEQGLDGESETIGLAVGFGVKYTIYHNFLANRPAAEFRAFLKNRRIPKHTKFAKELERVFAELNSMDAEEA